MASQSNCGMSVAIACVLLIILQSQFKNETGIYECLLTYTKTKETVKSEGKDIKHRVNYLFSR
jgi:hypothetical protein